MALSLSTYHRLRVLTQAPIISYLCYQKNVLIDVIDPFEKQAKLSYSIFSTQARFPMPFGEQPKRLSRAYKVLFHLTLFISRILFQQFMQGLLIASLPCQTGTYDWLAPRPGTFPPNVHMADSSTFPTALLNCSYLTS